MPDLFDFYDNFLRGEAKGKMPYRQKETEVVIGSNFALISLEKIICMNEIKEYLEELMDLKKECTIKFRDVDGIISIIKGHIVKVDSVSGRDMIETDVGFLIGTDQILELNGRSFENLC